VADADPLPAEPVITVRFFCCANAAANNPRTNNPQTPVLIVIMKSLAEQNQDTFRHAPFASTSRYYEL
jgi:hypothetical protein